MSLKKSPYPAGSHVAASPPRIKCIDLGVCQCCSHSLKWHARASVRQESKHKFFLHHIAHLDIAD